MNQRDTHLGNRTAPTLQKRLRDVGLLLLDCDQTGKLVSRPAPGSDWLTDLFCQAPIFIIALRQAAAQWSQPGQGHRSGPEPVQAHHRDASPRSDRRRFGAGDGLQVLGHHTHAICGLTGCRMMEERS